MPTRFNYKEIRKVREALGWTLRDVVEKGKALGLDVTEATLSNWENDDTTPPADKVDLLASVFSISLDRFYPER